MAEPENKETHNKLETKSDVKVVFEEDLPAYKLRFETHNQGLELWASIYPKQAGAIITGAAILSKFKQLNVTGDIDREGITLFCSQACLGNPLEDEVLVEGVPSEKGIDATVKFEKRPTVNKPRYEKDKRGSIDYRKLNLFDPVYKGDFIGKTTFPTAGKPGISVLGESIPPQKGLSLENPPKAGNGVRTEKNEEGELCFYAEMDGRIVYESNTISMSDQYVLHDDVDFSVGDIDFPGYVEIHGNIMNEFNIKAKEIKISGNVGVCSLESEGDIHIGGMSGNEIGSIKCGGGLFARYLDSCRVECRKNLVVNNEIVNCRIKCGGHVEVKGSLVGGECQVLEGIEAKTIGSEVGVRTKVICGVCYIAENKIKEIDDKLGPVTSQIRKLSKKLDPLVKNPKAVLGLSQRDRENFRKMAQTFNKLMPLQKEFNDKKEEIQKDANERANLIITVHKSIERGVEIKLGNIKKTTFQRIVKPLTVVRDLRNSDIRFTSPHPITDRSIEIERTLNRMEDEAAAKSSGRKDSDDE